MICYQTPTRKLVTKENLPKYSCPESIPENKGLILKRKAKQYNQISPKQTNVEDEKCLSFL